MARYHIGVDVGKVRHHVCVRDLSNDTYCRAFSVSNDQEAFATLRILKQGATSIDVAENVAKRMVGILKEYPHWHTSDEQSRQIRRQLYHLLEQANIKKIPETVEKIMSVIKRR